MHQRKFTDKFKNNIPAGKKANEFQGFVRPVDVNRKKNEIAI